MEAIDDDRSVGGDGVALDVTAALEKLNSDRAALVSVLDRQIAEARERLRALEDMRADAKFGRSMAHRNNQHQSTPTKPVRGGHRNKLAPEEFAANYRRVLACFFSPNSLTGSALELGWSIGKVQNYLGKARNEGLVSELERRQQRIGGNPEIIYRLTESGESFLSSEVSQ